MFHTLFLKCEFETDEFLCLNRMGCGALDYRQQAQQMELRTGGMSVSTQVIPDTTQLDVYEQVSARSAFFWISPVLCALIADVRPAATQTRANRKKSKCVTLVDSPVWLHDFSLMHAGMKSGPLYLRKGI